MTHHALGGAGGREETSVVTHHALGDGNERGDQCCDSPCTRRMARRERDSVVTHRALGGGKEGERRPVL